MEGMAAKGRVEAIFAVLCIEFCLVCHWSRAVGGDCAITDALLFWRLAPPAMLPVDVSLDGLNM